jgi:hypothetical protein
MSSPELEYYRTGRTPVYTAGFEIIENPHTNPDYEKIIEELSKEGALEIPAEMPLGVSGGDENSEQMIDMLIRAYAVSKKNIYDDRNDGNADSNDGSADSNVGSADSDGNADSNVGSADSDGNIGNADNGSADNANIDDLIEDVTEGVTEKVNGGADLDFSKYLRDE